MDRAGRGTADLRQPMASWRLPGNGAEQCLGVGVSWLIENRLYRAIFHHPAAIHHHHAINCFGDDAEIMGDHHQPHAEFRLQVFDQLQNLRLNGDVKSRCRFIGNQHLRTARQCHGNHRPLQHAAGELVRVAFEYGGGIFDFNFSQQ